MEMTTHSLSSYYAKPNSASPPFLYQPKSTAAAPKSVNFWGYNCLPRKLEFRARQLRSFGAIKASDSESSSETSGSARWLLEPIGQF